MTVYYCEVNTLIMGQQYENMSLPDYTTTQLHNTHQISLPPPNTEVFVYRKSYECLNMQFSQSSLKVQTNKRLVI